MQILYCDTVALMVVSEKQKEYLQRLVQVCVNTFTMGICMLPWGTASQKQPVVC